MIQHTNVSIVTVLHGRDVYQIRVDRINSQSLTGEADYFVARTGPASSEFNQVQRNSRHETKRGAQTAGFERVLDGGVQSLGNDPNIAELVAVIDGDLYGMRGQPTSAYLLSAGVDSYQVEFGPLALREMGPSEVTRGASVAATFVAAFVGILEQTESGE